MTSLPNVRNLHNHCHKNLICQSCNEILKHVITSAPDPTFRFLNPDGRQKKLCVFYGKFFVSNSQELGDKLGE